MELVVGLDAGGTSTRALVLDLDGARLGQGVAGGANPNSHPPSVAAAHIGEALAAALDGLAEELPVLGAVNDDEG